MHNARMLTAGILVSGLLLTGIAFAQGPGRGGPGPGHRGPGGPAGIGMALRGLTLTEAQRSLVREIQQRNRTEGQQAQERLRQAAAAQRAAVESVPMNEGLIRATTQDLAAAQTEVAIHRSRAYNDVWQVLTAAQQAEAATLRTQREQRMQERQAQAPRRQRGR